MSLLQEVDAIINRVSLETGYKPNLVEVLFGRIDAADPLLINITVHLGKLPGMGRSEQRALGCGASVDEAIDELKASIKSWMAASKYDLERRRKRRAERVRKSV